jgi:phosphoribosylanthranilate isomerase
MPGADFIIKVCGVTSIADGQFALDAGANALGFNFYPRSPRYLTPAQAAEIASGLRGSYLRVGVFVDAPLPQLQAIAEAVPLDVLQLHGTEAVVPDSGRYRIWRALPGESAPPAFDERIEAYLLDGATTAVHGGSGERFEWERARSFPYQMIVAGGLDGENVAAAIAMLQPWGVDACSRLESAPGRKDPRRVKAFTEAARAAALQQKVMTL